MVNNNIKKYITCFLGAVLLIIVTGCYDKTELEDRGFVMAIGIDKYDADLEENYISKENRQGNVVDQNYNLLDESNEAEENDYNMWGYNKVDDIDSNDINEDEDKTHDLVRLNAQAENPRYSVTITRANLGSIVGDLDEGNYIAIIDNETIAGALSVADLYANQSMYYGYAEVAVIGEEILKDPKLFRETVDALERNKGLSRELFIVTTQGKASDILTEDIKGDSLVGTFMSKLYRNNNSASKSGVFHKELESLSKSLNINKSAIIPSIVIEDGHVKLNGVAIIKDMQLLDWVDETEIRGYLWMLGKGEGLTIFTKYNDVYVPLNISTNRKKIEFFEEKERIICKVDINVVGTIEGYNFTTEGVYNEKILSELSNEYEKIIGEEIKNTFIMFYDKFLVDGYDFSEFIRKKNNDIYLKYNNQWDLLNNIETRINVNVEIKSIGSIK